MRPTPALDYAPHVGPALMPTGAVILLSLALPGLGSLLLCGRRSMPFILLLIETLLGTFCAVAATLMVLDAHTDLQELDDWAGWTLEAVYVLVVVWGLQRALRDRRQLDARGLPQASAPVLWKTLIWVATAAAVFGLACAFFTLGFMLIMGGPRPFLVALFAAACVASLLLIALIANAITCGARLPSRRIAADLMSGGCPEPGANEQARPSEKTFRQERRGMRNATLVAAICASLVLTGCRVDPSPRTVSRYLSDDGGVIKARYTGDYLLYRLPDSRAHRPPRPWSKARSVKGAELVTVVRLKKGQRIGFRHRSGSAGAVAVAGKRLLPLADGQYEWQVEPEQGRIDKRKTAWLVAVIVAGVALLGAAFVASLADSLESSMSDLNFRFI